MKYYILSEHSTNALDKTFVVLVLHFTFTGKKNNRPRGNQTHLKSSCVIAFVSPCTSPTLTHLSFMLSLFPLSLSQTVNVCVFVCVCVRCVGKWEQEKKVRVCLRARVCVCVLCSLTVVSLAPSSIWYLTRTTVWWQRSSNNNFFLRLSLAFLPLLLSRQSTICKRTERNDSKIVLVTEKCEQKDILHSRAKLIILYYSRVI